MRVRPMMLTGFGATMLLSTASLAMMFGAIYMARPLGGGSTPRVAGRVEVLQRLSAGDSAAALSACQMLGSRLFMGRPEISAATSEIFYSLRGGSEPGDPCGVVSQQFAPSTLAAKGTDAFLPLDGIQPCRWQDTRIADGGGLASSSMTEAASGSCNPGQGYYRLVPLAAPSGRLMRDPSRSAVAMRSDDAGCGTFAGKPLLWFNDDSAVASVGGEGYALSACGNPGVSAAPRLFRLLRASGAATQSILLDASGSAAGLARPRWVDLHQASLVPVGGTRALLVYAGDPQDGTGPRLAWGLLDLDPAKCPGSCVADRGGWLGGNHRGAEKYPLGAAVKGSSLALAYLHADQRELWESCSDGAHQCLPGDSGALSIRVLDVADPGKDPAVSEVDVEYVDTPSLVDATFRTAATHPDIAWSGDDLLLTYALVHYPSLGCGDGGLEPCRWRAANPKPGEDDVKFLSVRLARLTF